jgi:AcrR family transcriptional regulator
VARRTQDEAASTRRAIIAAARVLFAERGFAATVTTEVVRRAGVTRGALYHHFADKTDLFRAVFQDLEHELNQFVVERARAERDPLDGFMAGSRAYIEFAERADWRQIAVVDAPAVLGQEEWHATDVAIGLASMEYGLAALHQARVIDEPPTRELATVLFGALTEAGLAAARGDAEADALFDAFARLIERLGPRSTA